jgi:hypothetical protein
MSSSKSKPTLVSGALLSRRAIVRAALGCGFVPTALAQTAGGTSGRLAQLMDRAPAYQELSRDYATGIRLAWAVHGERGAPLPQVQAVEVDSRDAASVRSALTRLRDDPGVIGLLGAVGDRVAVDSVTAAREIGWRIAHVSPWMSDARHDDDRTVFSNFPSRATQLRYAVSAVQGMGFDRIVAVYPSAQEHARSHGAIDAASAQVGLRTASLVSAAGEDTAALSVRLAAMPGGLVLFLGGAAELAVLTQAMGARGVHRFVLSLSDVDESTLAPMALDRSVPVILTQVVPNPQRSALPVALQYRAALQRFFDEAPSSISFAGFLAGSAAAELCRRAGARSSRDALLAEVERRAPMNLGGFAIEFAEGARGSRYITHTLLGGQGRLVG